MSRMIAFDGQFTNGGCDVIKVKEDLTFLIEIKRCNISREDANDAIRQLDFTECWLKNNCPNNPILRNLNLSKLKKIFLHDKRRNCGMYANFLFKKKRILRPDANKPEWRTVINFARRNGLP